MDKKLLRKWAKDKRNELNMPKLSVILAEKLAQTDEYNKSKNIMLFYPLNDEVNLLSLLEDETKNFYLPRINGDNLECCKYIKGDELCESCFHTKEPTCKACAKTDIDFVIVPALACDKNGFRLGYGGGFYDRFLTDFKGIKAACVPQELIVDTISPQEYDIKMDIIITDLF